MKTTSPIVQQSTRLTSLSMPLFKCGFLLGITLLNVACSAADPLGSPSLAAAQPEMTPDSPFTSIPKSEEPVVPSTQPEPSTTPASIGNTSIEPAGTVLPEIPTDETQTELPDSQTSVETTVNRAVCSSSDSDMQQRMLQLINEARSTDRVCGSESFRATRALQWNTDLAAAAKNHSEDMATHNFFDHTGSDGSFPSARVTSQGYRWRTVGENIAAGRETAAETLDDWLESAGHCRNIMNPSFTQVAVACVENNNSDFRRYWTNVLAAQR